MSFEEIFATFTSGTPIKRVEWEGYWRYNNGVVEIYTKDEEMIDFQKTEDVLYTISQITQSDWEIATDENTIIPIIEPLIENLK